jgi:hypothetical protein
MTTTYTPQHAATAPAEAVDIDAELNVLKFTRLDSETALQPCDGHASAGVTAVVRAVKGAFEILLCGHCARRWGYEHTQHAPEENRQKGAVS